MKFEKIVLEGEHVRLEPLSQQHKDGLCQVITESELWKIFVTTIPHPCEIDAFYDEARCTFDNNEGLAFAIIDKKSGINFFSHTNICSIFSRVYNKIFS